MIIEYICIVCGIKCRKQRSPAGILTFPKYCSQKCHGIHKHSLKIGPTPNYTGICEYCGTEFKTYRSPSNMKLTPRFCSLQCLGKSQKGENNPAYNGGKYICNGYYVLFKPDHPYRDTKNMILEHRFVMECKIGRYLTSKEVVHHKDENKLNNDPENLQLFPNNSEHLKFHAKLKQKNKWLKNKS
jgi:hypothetical protein